MVQDHLLDSLSERLTKDAQIFNDLLSLIPAKFYVTEKNEDNDSKFMHNKRKKAPKQAIKEATKKAKKLKLDPENAKSIVEIQQEKQAKKEQEEADQEDEEEEEESEEEDDEEEEESSDDDDNIKETEGEKMDVDPGAFSGLDDNESIATDSTATESVNLQPMEKSDINQLRNRLHERISQLRKKRNAPGSNSAKPRSREEILAARNKKKEDRKKAIKAQKEKGGKVASEEIVTMEKNNRKNSQHNGPNADSIKMDGDVFFGKLAVGGQQKKKKGPTDAKSQLKILEAKKEKMDKLKSENKDKAEAMKEKDEWNKVIAMATGEKQKDNIQLLKKSIKRQEKQKSKSGQEWNKRIEKVKYDEKKAIKKREENIKAKIDEKKNKKRGIKTKPVKKSRPGFEGGKRSKGGKVTKPSPPKHKK